MDIEQRIADYIHGLHENVISPYSHVAEMGDDTMEALNRHLLEAHAADPEGFEARFALLENVSSIVGEHARSHPGADTRSTEVSANLAGFYIAVGEDLLNDPNYSFLDDAISGIAHFQVNEARVAANQFRDYPPGIDDFETRFVESAQWLRDAQRAGVEGIDIPAFYDRANNGQSNFMLHTIDEAGDFVYHGNMERFTVEDLNVAADTPATEEPSLNSPAQPQQQIMIEP